MASMPGVTFCWGMRENLRRSMVWFQSFAVHPVQALFLCAKWGKAVRGLAYALTEP